MDEKELEKRLNNTPLPDIRLNESKNNLRRNLLNSGKYSRIGFFNLIFKKEYLLATTVSILITLIILFNYFSFSELTTKDLISLSNNHYASVLNNGGLNYLENELEIFGTNNDNLKVKVEKWFDQKNEKFHIRMVDKNSQELLDELIILNDKVYRSPNPKIQVYNTINNRHELILSIADSLVSTGAKMQDSVLVLVDVTQKGELNKIKNDGILFYNRSSAISEEINITDKNLFSMPVSKHLDLQDYLSADPLNILEEIETIDDVEISEIYFDSEKQADIALIELTKANFEKPIIGVITKLDSNSLPKTIVSTNIEDSTKQNEIATAIQNAKKSSSNNKMKSFSVKLVKINMENGKIESTEFGHSESGKLSKLSKINFGNISTGTPTEDLFNPTSKNMEWVGQVKKIVKVKTSTVK